MASLLLLAGVALADSIAPAREDSSGVVASVSAPNETVVRVLYPEDITRFEARQYDYGLCWGATDSAASCLRQVDLPNVNSNPRVLTQVKPKVEIQGSSFELTGRVQINLFVNTYGRPEYVCAIDPPNEFLAVAAARAAVAQEYAPHIQGGFASCSWLTFFYDF